MRALFLCLTAVLALSGCASYHLGSGGKLTFKTLYVAPATNASTLPQSAALVSAELRQEFLADGRVTLGDSATGADVVLTVKLLKYHRDVVASQASDTGLARQFNVTLHATASLWDNRTGKFLFKDRAFDAVREVFTDSGQLQAEYNTVPLLAQTLSAQILSATLDVW